MNRREFLLNTLNKTGLIALGPSLLQLSSFSHSSMADVMSKLGPLQTADANGILLPEGFQSRVVAISGERVAGTNTAWHNSPDGGACFPTPSGGWVYVSNSEEYFFRGGASAIEFDPSGNIVDARNILSGTHYNCAGGATPWNTWLSCEEIDRGVVYETDPFGKHNAVKRKALGYFKHEAVAVDPVRQQLYLTEDEPDGCLYRFTPSKPFPYLESGTLEVAIVSSDHRVTWHPLNNPTPYIWQTRTRNQIKDAMHFDGGEGIWYQAGIVYFSTKGDDRVWALDTELQSLEIVYDAADSDDAILTGVDNLTGTQSGQILVAEDGGNMQIVMLDGKLEPKPFVQVIGQPKSEITGPAFSPDGTRFYFSSQRGHDLAKRQGITYEVSLRPDNG